LGKVWLTQKNFFGFPQGIGEELEGFTEKGAKVFPISFKILRDGIFIPRFPISPNLGGKGAIFSKLFV